LVLVRSVPVAFVSYGTQQQRRKARIAIGLDSVVVRPAARAAPSR
jgi:hypothetical protein